MSNTDLKREWDAIDAEEASVESRRWSLAKRLTTENDAGRSHRDLALETGRNDRTVGKWIAVHRQCAPAGGRTFNECLLSVSGLTAEGERARKDVSATRKVLREADDSAMQEIVAALPEEQRTKLVTAAVNVPRPHGGRNDPVERDILRSIQDAPTLDLSAQATKLVAAAAQIEVLLGEGAEFLRMDAKALQRMDRDLDRVRDTAEKLQEQIGAQSKVRRVV